jgi:hypothetical protein
MIEKKLILQDLKEYESRHGFVFAGAIRSSDQAIQNLVNVIKNSGFSDDIPEFYARIGDNTVMFVYPEGTSFKSGDFYHISKQMEFIQLFEIETLSYFIKHRINSVSNTP